MRQWRIVTRVVFVETRAFTARARALLSDEDYRLLQAALLARPETGTLVPGGGGLRKMRWGAEGRGKRSGLRLLYYWHPASERILFLFLFSKNERPDLTPRQLAALRKVIETEYP